MKKLLFTFAGAAALAALAADPAARTIDTKSDISLVGFESYTADATVIGYNDGGTEGNSLWTATGDDASLVKTYGGDNAAAPSITVPAPFSDGGDKYLALDTNGSELQRDITTTVDADGTYIDTLVQFTPSESAPTGSDLTGAKLAIWLGVVNNVTNLYVQGNYWDFDSAPVGTSQAYALTGKAIEPGTWYRLTVKAIPNILNENSGMSIPAFQIFVDGTDMVLSSSPLSAGFAELLDQSSMYASADIQTAAEASKLVPSIQEEAGQYGATVTLTSVGFKGTGALDDFVVTTIAPDLSAPAIDFTLTWDGVTPVSYTIDGGTPVSLSGETSPFAVPGLVGGETVVFTFTNADGVTKTMTATAADDGDIDSADAVYTWADYLGDAVNGAYEIDNLAELKLFQKGVANTNELTTANTTFKLTADVALDEAWPGIGLPNGKDVYSTAAFNAAAFCGTFDGQNHTISGFQMVGVAGNPAGGSEGLDYCGFFNSTYGATIQNLKIAYAGSLFAADTTASTKESGATFVGVAKNSTLDNLTTVAGTVSCSKGFGGIVGYLTSGTTVQNCTNNLNMTSLANNKCGGIAMITQGGSAVTISNCQNNGTQTTGSSNSEYGAIVGYVGLDVTIADCETTVGRFLKHQGNTVTLQGVNKGDPTVPAYHGAATPGLNFASVDGNVATFVADNALAAGNTYKVLGPSATATYEFAAAGSISFDTNLIQTVTFAITAPGLDLTDATESGVVTYTAAAQSSGADWVDDVTTVTNKTAAEAYSDLADTALANANAAKLTTWAKANNVTFSAAETDAADYVEAFMLNCAPTAAAVEAEKEAFKVNITMGADGTPVVTTPEGKVYNVTPQLKGATSLTGEWTTVSEGSTSYQFYKAVLSL